VDGVLVESATLTTLYQEDPLKCTFGMANPNYFMPLDTYCSLISPPVLVAEVIGEKEIEDGGKNTPNIDG